MENINIASFDFDDEKIRKKIGELDKIIEDFNSKRLKELENLKKLTESLTDVNSLIGKMNKEVSTNSDETKKLAEQQEKLVKQIAEQKAKIAELNQKLAEQKKEQAEVNRVKKESEKQSKAEQKAIEQLARANEILNHGYDTENKSINQLREDRKALIKLRNDEVAVMGEQSEKAQKLNKLIAEMTNQEKSLVSDTEKRFYQIGDYANQLEGHFSGVIDAINQITSGNVIGGVNSLKGAFNGLVTSARAFVATPIGAVVTALVAIGGAVKYIWDYNSAIKENLNLVSQLTGQTGLMADEIRQSVQSIAEVYNKDFKETLQEVKELANDFGITYANALDIYSKGIAQGGALNNEFGDSIREYGVLFQQAGYSADEFVSLLNTGFDLGIYTDKLPDAIKEAGISLNEQTKATKDALVNAFGSAFANDILKRVRTGQTSVKDALQEIAKESEKVNLNQQQQAQLTADLFRGAGEDAGGALKVFEALNKSVEDLNRPLTDVEQKQYDLQKAVQEFEKAKDSAFKSEVVMNFQSQLELTWVKIKTGGVNAIATFVQVTTDGFAQINAGLGTFDAYMQNLDRVTKNFSFDNMTQSFKNFVNAVTSFDWGGTYDKLAGDSSSSGQMRRQIRDALGGVARAGQDALNQRNKTTARSTSNNLGNSPQTKSTSRAKSGVDQAKKDLDTAIKLQEKYLQEYAQLQYEYGQKELENQIKLNADKVKNAQIVSDAMLEITKNQLSEELKLKQDSIKKELEFSNQKAKEDYNNSVAEIEKLKISEQQKNELKLNADNVLKSQLALNQQNFQTQQFENQKLFDEQVSAYELELYESKKAIEQQRKEFDFQQRLIEIDNYNVQETEKELMHLNLRYQQEMAMLRDQLNQKLITNEEFKIASENLSTELARNEIEIERIKQNQRLSIVADTLGSISSIFEENTMASKIFGQAQALINTYIGASEQWRSASTLPQPFNIIQRVGAVATALAGGMQAVKAISKVNVKGGNSVSLSGSASGGTTTNTYKSAYAGGSNSLQGNSVLSGYNQNNTFNDTKNIDIFTNAIKEGAKLGTQQGSKQGSQEGLKEMATDRQILNEAKY